MSATTVTGPEEAPTLCPQCQRVISEIDPKIEAAKRLIEEKTMQLCLNAGKANAVAHYLTEINKLPDHHLSPHDAKAAVEQLINARGIRRAVKKPGKNAGVIILIVALLAIASVVYFFTHT